MVNSINQIYNEANRRELDNALLEIAKRAAKGFKPAVIRNQYNQSTIKALINEGFKVDTDYIEGQFGGTFLFVDWDTNKVDNQFIKHKQLK